MQTKLFGKKLPFFLLYQNRKKKTHSKHHKGYSLATWHLAFISLGQKSSSYWLTNFRHINNN